MGIPDRDAGDRPRVSSALKVRSVSMEGDDGAVAEAVMVCVLRIALVRPGAAWRGSGIEDKIGCRNRLAGQTGAGFYVL